jgi:gliding motility-associated-like protein
MFRSFIIAKLKIGNALWIILCLNILTTSIYSQLPMPDTACVGQTKQYTIVPGSNHVSVCRWFINGVEQADFNSYFFNHTWDSPGIYRIDVQEFPMMGCPGPLRSGWVFVRAQPLNPLVNLGKDTFICNPDRLLLDAGNQGKWYEWSNGSRDQYVWVSESDISVWVRVTDLFHCSSYDTIRISACPPIKKLVIPNVFTPNGDGVNDVWNIAGIQSYPQCVVKIFDRWGRLIYISERGYPHPWNGKKNGAILPMDAYYFVLDTGDGQKPIRGSVTLIP